MEINSEFVIPIGNDVTDVLKQRCEQLKLHLTQLSAEVSNLHDHESRLITTTDLLGRMRQLFGEMFELNTQHKMPEMFGNMRSAALDEDTHDFDEWAEIEDKSDTNNDQWGHSQCDQAPEAQAFLYRLRKGTEAKSRVKERIEKLLNQVRTGALPTASTDRCSQSILHSFANEAYKHTESLACIACNQKQLDRSLSNLKPSAMDKRKSSNELSPDMQNGYGNSEITQSDNRDASDDTSEATSMFHSNYLRQVAADLAGSSSSPKGRSKQGDLAGSPSSPKRRSKQGDLAEKDVPAKQARYSFRNGVQKLDHIITQLNKPHPQATDTAQSYRKSYLTILTEYRTALSSIDKVWEHTSLMYNMFAKGIEEIAGVRVDQLVDEESANVHRNTLEQVTLLVSLASTFKQHICNTSTSNINDEFLETQRAKAETNMSKFNHYIEHVRMQIISGTPLWCACHRVFSDIHERNPHLQHRGMTTGLLMDIRRNSLWSQYQRLVALDYTMCRRLSGIKTTFASDYRRIANQYRITMFLFANTSIVDVNGKKCLATDKSLKQNTHDVALDAQLFNVVALWDEIATLEDLDK